MRLLLRAGSVRRPPGRPIACYDHRAFATTVPQEGVMSPESSAEADVLRADDRRFEAMRKED